MTNRKLEYIVKDQKPLVLAAHETVQHACRCMRERPRCGAYARRRPACRSDHPGAGDDAESRHDHAGEPRNRSDAKDERWRLPSSSGR